MLKPVLMFAAVCSFGLAACAKSDSANEQGQADNVELPAEEAMNSAEPDAMPASDAAALPGADASLSPTPGSTDAGAAKAAEAATKAAEKKM